MSARMGKWGEMWARTYGEWGGWPYVQHQRGQQQRWQLQHDCGGDNDNNSCSRSGSRNITTSSGRDRGQQHRGGSPNGSSGSRDRGGSRSNGNGCGSRAYYMALLPLPPLFIYLFLVVFILSLYFKYFGEKQTGFV